MVLDIVTFPAESLRKKSAPVEEITDEIKELINNMIDTLYEAKGYGLAAPQVGYSLRIIVIDETGSQEPRHPQVFINPEFTSTEGEMIGEEGCLSIPGEFAPVKRFQKVTVKALNEKGEEIRMEAEENLARIFQHEIDHLNGVLFLDKLPAFRKDTLKKHIKKRIQSGDYVVYGA